MPIIQESLFGQQTIKEQVSLAQLCKELKISEATGKNWIKLGKISPSEYVGKTPYFDKKMLNELKDDIKSGKIKALKSRRNKKYTSGNSIYDSYISKKSKNYVAVQNIISTLENQDIEITRKQILMILAQCAIQLFLSKENAKGENNVLEQFLSGSQEAKDWNFLLKDLLEIENINLSDLDKSLNIIHSPFIFEANEDTLGLLYISLKNLNHRKASGIYYTPTHIVNELIENLLSKNEYLGKSIIDPCCGSGNFLLHLPSDIDPKYIYGNDIDPISIRLTRINMRLKYGNLDSKFLYSHFTEKDYLNDFDNKYDMVLGNPPWGCDFSNEDKKRLQSFYETAQKTNIESYDVFIEKTVSKILKEGGTFSFIVPEALLNVKSHKEARKILMGPGKLQYLSFLGNVFPKVQCPCIIIQKTITSKEFNIIGLTIKKNGKKFSVHIPRSVKADCFDFFNTDEETRILNKIDSLPDVYFLKDQSDFALGIVTGNNKKYLSDVRENGMETILKGSDLHKYIFDENNNYICFRPDQFQQVASSKFYRAEEKLLYKFISNKLVFAYDDKQTLSLNSCNIVIPKIKGLNIKYVLAILNSKVAQFYFDKRFNSIKILRSHIESIPIPYATEKEQIEIINLVDTILKYRDIESIPSIQEEIDCKIFKLFLLSEKEISIIVQSISE